MKTLTNKIKLNYRVFGSGFFHGPFAQFSCHPNKKKVILVVILREKKHGLCIYLRNAQSAMYLQYNTCYKVRHIPDSESGQIDKKKMYRG